MIQQKIANGEGMLKLQNRGWVTAQLYNEKTDSAINPIDWQNWQADTIVFKPTKHDYKIVNDELILKTVEDRIIDIRDKAREKLLEMKNKIELEETKKIQLTEISDWTSGDETKLTDMNDDYDKAVEDYNSIKTQLMQTVNNEVAFEAKKFELKDTFAKYKIKI